MLQTTTAAAIRRALTCPITHPLRGAILIAGLALTSLAFAQENDSHGAVSTAPATGSMPSKRATQLATVKVNANGDPVGYAMKPDYAAKRADLGPLGQANLLQTPYAISVLPVDLLVNSLAMDPTELLRYLPSTQLEYRSGAALGRPQSRGFEGEMVSNSRIDGLNALDSTSYGIEQFDNITVLNGLAGALYGPQVPGGIFEYNDKRPSEAFLNRLSLGIGSDGIATEAGDFGGRLGNDGWFGYRVNLAHGEGSGPYPDSHLDRNLVSGAFDIHFSDKTVLQLDTSSYHFGQRGYPGIFIYNAGGNTVLPSARSSTQTGYGQPYGGMDLDTSTHLAKLTHDFNEDWHVTVGALHQVADRYLPVISNNFTNNNGGYTATLGQNSISRFTINSNLAYLTGTFDTGSLENDVTFGTNGYDEQRAYGHTPTSVTLGSSNYYASAFLPEKPWGANPGFGHPPLQTRNEQQSLIAGDTVHFTSQWAVMGVISDSYLSTRNFSRSGQQTSDYQVHDAFSPTVSLIYTPSATDTFYLTYASSEQPGDTAPQNALNANDTLAPYRSKQYEFGYKTRLGGITLGSALFSMQRAYALVDADDVYRVAGEQRNNGLEVSAAGNLTSNLAIYGGFTWLDATLENTHNRATDDKRVVGVPRLQSSLLLDYNLATLPRAVNAWAFSIGLHQTGHRAATTTNNSYAAGYATLDLGTRMSFSLDKHPLIVRLALNNATNTHYWASVYPGSVNGGTASDTAALGVPRTWQASVELDL